MNLILDSFFEQNPLIMVLETKSVFGEEVKIAGAIVLDDYVSVLSNNSFSPDYVFISRSSFDNNLDDITLKNINELYSKIRKPIILM